MPVSFDTVAKEALDLTPRQRLKLAKVLLVSADGEPDSDCQEAWDAEIKTRILVIDESRETGVSFEEVMADADNLLMNQRAKTHDTACK